MCDEKLKEQTLPLTQENCRASGYKERQVQITLNNKIVWVDPELAPLLVALNQAGLETRSHCCGHDTNPAWVAIKTDRIKGIEIRNDGPYKELLITWELDPNCIIPGS